ncbi:hypothetical protein Pdw03_2622 [Penicillium digitatum]|uniref:Myb-like DNA-binding domain-containing protein n=3 Tax=Penicillium digitatum TaxID=36651 RepID=K9GVS8_PEND2|nr:hypothetical protein PDIP_88290 [Penicillium digitatum Pd1]EKV04321.1 hypothetical protein PDIP_88290 [Penicillium digitatum Pd1]EKV17191.1 hypothetical protein PDIG_16780 [Penicillium digitatum PHI26]KAG0153158.1 hypothetical protein PDIDSM_5008 [Penicillium digitatum]QQK39768.1 hypothetical protein Pdw03_2622 [Penicillium digitatum]
MASQLKKGKEPANAVSQSKVKKTRATPKKEFTQNEIFLYHAIKSGEPKFDYYAIGKVLGKSKDAVRMQMSRLLKDVGEFIKDHEDLAQMAQPEHEENSDNKDDAENGSRDDKDGSKEDKTSVETGDMEDI